MDTKRRASLADTCSSPKRNATDSSSKEKKILQGRRQQRHSTEIGSEYHRWWVIRNALGFERNEHIAGLLLDGFHGLLQHLVIMCGGETYQSSMHAEPRLLAEANDCCEDVAQSQSSSTSASPPGGIENIDEFMEYRNAISHYCNSLWRMCCQQGSQLQQLDKTSQPVQKFLNRLMGYLRSAKGKSFSLNPKKKLFKSNSVCVRNIVEGSLSQVNMAKLCPPVAHHESQSIDAALSSNAQCTAETSADEHQHSCVDKSTSCLEPVRNMLTQVGTDQEEKTYENIVEESVQSMKGAREKCLYDDQSPCSYFQMKHHSKEKEQTDLQQEKRTQQYYAHLQTAVVASNICDQKEQSTTSCDTKYNSTDPPACAESGFAKFIIIEASCEQKTSVTMSPGTILNSLLTNKDVSCSIKNCLSCQKLNSGINDDVLNVALNKNGSTDLSASNTVDKVSSHQGGHQGSSMKCTSKKKRRATDAASTTENKSGAVTSSSKPLHGRHLTCPVCEVVVLSCMDLLVHRLEQHGYVCGECDSRFLTLTRLKQHKEVEHPLMLICSRCRFHTFGRRNLVDHVWRSDLIDHLWSVHGVTMNETDSSKDETQSCGVIGGSFIDVMHDTADAAVVQQKLNEDSPMKMLNLEKDICANKRGNVRNKQDLFVVTSESADAIYHQGQVVNGQVFVDTKENKYSRRISLPESESFKDMVVGVSGQASSGPVFPSFSREVSDTVRSDQDTMSAMFAQLCQLESADFLNVSDQHASKNEEPRLVIDTEVSCGKNTGRHGREQYKETVAARADQGRPAALAPCARSKDKSCNCGLCKSKTSRLTARARNNCLSDQEIASDSSVQKEAQSKISDICMKEEGQVMNVAAKQGKERERLIMSISLKRNNSTSVYESHSRRRRKRRKSKRIVDSSNDVDCVEGGNSERETCSENSYSSKHFHSAKHTFCYDVPESSCDHISSYDHMDKHARQGVKLGQVKVPTRDLFLQCRENFKTICPLVNHTEPLKNHLGKDAIDCPEKLAVKPAILGEPGINGCEISQSENVLSLTERHIMSSLPPKKRKLNLHELGMCLQQLTTRIPTEVHVPQKPDKKDNRRYSVFEENREDNCGGGDNQEN